MKIYIVHRHYHYDDNKRGESFSKIEEVFKNEELAYKYAINEIFQENNVFRDYFYENSIKSEFYTETIIDKIKSDYTDYKQKYDLIISNFIEVFGEPEFSLFPTHTMFYVTEAICSSK
jgi:hypothetical protein